MTITPTSINSFPSTLETSDNNWHDIADLTIPDHSMSLVTATVVASDESANGKAFQLSAAVVRPASGSATVVGGLLDVVDPRGTGGAAIWDARIQATATDKIAVQVKAPALVGQAPTVSWSVQIAGLQHEIS